LEIQVRKQFVLLIAGLALAVSACTPPEQNPAAEQEAAPVLVHSRGTVFAVTREYNAITIQHEPIPEYTMPAMTMEFTVDEASRLDGIEAGDRVAFVLSGGLDIQSIEKVEAE
jgi:Cu/Ag efflux protein CusF